MYRYYRVLSVEPSVPGVDMAGVRAYRSPSPELSLGTDLPRVAARIARRLKDRRPLGFPRTTGEKTPKGLDVYRVAFGVRAPVEVKWVMYPDRDFGKWWEGDAANYIGPPVGGVAPFVGPPGDGIVADLAGGGRIEGRRVRSFDIDPSEEGGGMWVLSPMVQEMDRSGRSVRYLVSCPDPFWDREVEMNLSPADRARFERLGLMFKEVVPNSGGMVSVVLTDRHR